MRKATALIMVPGELAEFHAERADLYEHFAALFASPPNASELAVLCSALEIGAERAHTHDARILLVEALHKELDAPPSAIYDAFRSAAADFESLFCGAMPLVSLACSNPHDPPRMEICGPAPREMESARSRELFALAKLADRCSHALSLGDPEESELTYALQVHFIDAHARACLLPFAIEVESYAGPFYSRVARALHTLIEEDDRRLVRPVLQRLASCEVAARF